MEIKFILDESFDYIALASCIVALLGVGVSGIFSYLLLKATRNSNSINSRVVEMQENIRKKDSLLKLYTLHRNALYCQTKIKDRFSNCNRISDESRERDVIRLIDYAKELESRVEIDIVDISNFSGFIRSRQNVQVNFFNLSQVRDFPIQEKEKYINTLIDALGSFIICIQDEISILHKEVEKL